jgi:hypothetical protein
MGRQYLVTPLLIGYLSLVVVLMLSRNVSISPDRFFVFLLFAAVIVGRLKTFLRDWLPFVALILAYDMLRGFADNHFAVHVAGLANAERASLPATCQPRLCKTTSTGKAGSDGRTLERRSSTSCISLCRWP